MELQGMARVYFFKFKQLSLNHRVGTSVLLNVWVFLWHSWNCYVYYHTMYTTVCMILCDE